MTYETMRLEQDGAIARLTLTRPEDGNTLTPLLAKELRDAALRCRDDETIRAVLLSAEGDMFSAGGDVGEFAAAGDNLPAVLKTMLGDFHGAVEILATMDAPVVTAVNGMAAGGGFSLVLMSRYVVAADSARFVMAYTGIGLSPDGGSTYFLPRLVGLRRAEELMLTNRRLSAQEALEWGIINRITDENSVLAEAEKMVQTLARGPTKAYARVRSLLLASSNSSLTDQLNREGEAIVASAKTADGKEGIAGFAGKRKPDFTGR